MDTFEDNNPFDEDGENIQSEASSASKVDLSDPPSPTREPSSSPLSRPFPSPGSHKQPQTTFKSDFCCTRDRVLHSGEDVEILVREAIFLVVLHSKAEYFKFQDHRRAEDFNKLNDTIHYICHPYWSKAVYDIPSSMLIGFRTPKRIIGTQNSSPCERTSLNSTQRS